MENNSDDARDSLAAIADAHSAAADRLVTPWWYHPALGLLAAGFYVTFILGGLVAELIAIPLLALGVLGLIFAYRRVTGVWIGGYSAGRASRWTYLLVAVIIVAGVAGAFLHLVIEAAWPGWVAGVIVFLAVNVMGRQFDVSVRKQLRSAP